MQAHLLQNLLGDLDRCCNTYPLEVLLTLNLPEVLPFDPQGYSFPVVVIDNLQPKGFSANHNHAFTKSTGAFYCVMNPDVRLNEEVFSVLLASLQDKRMGVVAPLVLGAGGEVEDSARRFPTPFKILCKAFGGCRGSDYELTTEMIQPDWVAGMFMVFRREVFEEIGGFDEGYFLYYEDVDICARLRLHGYLTVLHPAAKVIHYAHRSSHRSLKYMRWHLSSMLRFFCAAVFFRVLWLRLTK